MPRNPRTAARPLVQIHDHYDGSAHCRECGGGSCQLTGLDRQITTLVRYLFEEACHPQGTLPGPMLRQALGDLGVNLGYHTERALETRIELEEFMKGRLSSS